MVAVLSFWLALIRCIRCKLQARNARSILTSGRIFPLFLSPQPAKITGSLFAQWLDIMRQIPHAILWLTTVAEGSAHATRLRGEAAARGIFAKRLIFASAKRNGASASDGSNNGCARFERCHCVVL